MAAGDLWSRCGYRSEVARLRAVMIARPPASVAGTESPREALMRAPVDLGRIRAEATEIAAAYRRFGVAVEEAAPPADAPPNVVFLRDLFFMTPAGAVVGRTASAQRAGEERYAAAALAAAGYPILLTVAGRDTFEGADALWLDPETVVIGVGFRTTVGGAAKVGSVLEEQGVRVVTVPLGAGVQHLLGSLAHLDERVAAIRVDAVSPELRELLSSRGYRLVELPPDRDMVAARGMNLVALAPGHVLMPAGAAGMRRRLTAAGIETDEVRVDEYLKADGGLGCLTGVLLRD